MAVYHCRCAFLWFFLLHKQKKEQEKNLYLKFLPSGNTFAKSPVLNPFNILERSKHFSTTTWITSLSTCSFPSTIINLDCRISRRYLSMIFSNTTRLAVPVSSSIVIKQTPFAVPGRWRTKTSPATFTLFPFFKLLRSLVDTI